jgi:hypothetical protein
MKIVVVPFTPSDLAGGGAAAAGHGDTASVAPIN